MALPDSLGLIDLLRVIVHLLQRLVLDRVIDTSAHSLRRLVVDLYELVFDLLLSKVALHLRRRHLNCVQAHLTTVGFPVLFEVDKAILHDVQVLDVFFLSLILPLLVFDELCALQEVVLNPELKRVHQRWQYDEYAHDLGVWMAYEDLQQPNHLINQIVRVLELNSKLQQLGNCTNKYPHHELNGPDFVVNVLVQIFVRVEVDVLRVMDRKIDSRLKCEYVVLLSPHHYQAMNSIADAHHENEVGREVKEVPVAPVTLLALLLKVDSGHCVH